MADIHARMRQLLQSTADWGATDPVLGLGEIGFERRLDGSIHCRIGDGVARWSALPEWTPAAPVVAPVVSNVRGVVVNATGTLLSGTAGITVAKTQVGVYTLTLATPLASPNKTAVTATATTSAILHAVSARVTSVTSILVTTWAAGANPHADDAGFALHIVEVP